MPATRITPGSLWLAGVGAVSLARRRGRSMLGEFVAEGRRLHGEAGALVRATRADTRAQVNGLIEPLKARFDAGVEAADAALRRGVGRVLARLGLPSKADVDELAQRVGALSRKLKSAK